MLLSSLGCTAYQERVPLQLLDFAYRHSSSILSDVLRLSSDTYILQQTRARDAPPGGRFREADGQVSANAVMLAIQKSVAVSVQWLERRSRIEQGAFVGDGIAEE